MPRRTNSPTIRRPVPPFR